MLELNADVCSDFEASTSREWLETNGIGGFACGTVSGANTRRYHALLTAATRPPLGRVTYLSKFEERVLIDGSAYELSTDRFPGTIEPRGFEHLRSFRLDPFPVWEYEIDGLRIVRSVFMVHGANTTVTTWSIKRLRRRDARAVRFEARPLVSFTDYHHLQNSASQVTFEHSTSDGSIELRSSTGYPPLYFFHDGRVEGSGYWYKNFELAIERERGFDYYEDLYQPFVILFDDAAAFSIVTSTDATATAAVSTLERDEKARRRALVRTAAARGQFERQLTLAADQFIVRRDKGHTIIAGYPWFSDWGRDTMISLRGLTLAVGRPQIARDIILEFAGHISEGMLPNRFPDAGDTAEYNTVDATLWYFDAVRAYIDATGDLALADDVLYEKLADIVAWHLRGTRYGIHVDTDGLLRAGESGVQLTWMDAKIGDLVITPRSGKAVEIQALWYNALRIMADLAGRLRHDEDRARFDAMADLAKLSFNSVFWNAEDDCLYDVVVNSHRDASIRPNQIFALSLEYTMLDADRSGRVLDVVTKQLLTPFGLRSLAPSDEKYVPVYSGSPFDRDSAYHQGTVWAWLIGPYVDAFRRVKGDSKDTERQVDALLSAFRIHLYEAGLGQVSEIFDAEPPHLPRGCFAQAWSVAELLRVTLGDPQ